MFNILNKGGVKMKSMQSLKKIVPYVARHRLLYLVLGLLIGLDIVVTIGLAWFLAAITDAAVAGDMISVKGLVFIGIGIVLLLITSQFLKVYVENLAVNKVRYNMKNDVFNHVLQLPTAYHTKNHTGELVSRLTNDMQQIGGAIGNNLIYLISHPLTSLAVFIYLINLNWQLACLILIMAPSPILFSKVFGKRLRENGTNIQVQVGKINRLLHDVFVNHTIVHAFGLQRYFSNEYDNLTKENVHLENKEGRYKASLQSSLSGISVAIQFMIIILGALFVVNKTLSVGAYLAFIQLSQVMITPFSSMGNLWGEFQRSLAAVDRIFQVLSEKVAGTTMAKTAASVPSKLKKGIVFQDVSFAYQAEQAVLKNINLTIPSGKTIAIVGPSGAGKSSLFKLILGYYQLNQGNIKFDKMELSNETVHYLREYLTYVAQEAYLFSGTIAENIKLGKLDASKGEIEEAAKKANAHDFISHLPQAYETEIGENGMVLSGGQRQRIAIARALIREAPVLLLDEATSALDAASEAAIQATLEKIKQDRTTLIIAHRLSTIQKADYIIVMDQGRIVEANNFKELMKGDSVFAKLYQLQFREMKEGEGRLS